MHPENPSNKKGFTLVETLITLLILGLVAALSLSTLSFFTQISDFSTGRKESDRKFEKIHLFLQQQIDRTEKVYVKNGVVYLQDWDDKKKGYYNKYVLEKTGMLFRYKVDGSKFRNVQGSPNEFEYGLSSFSLTLETVDGAYTGNILLQAVFLSNQEQVYETTMDIPAGKDAIITL